MSGSHRRQSCDINLPVELRRLEYVTRCCVRLHGAERPDIHGESSTHDIGSFPEASAGIQILGCLNLKNRMDAVDRRSWRGVGKYEESSQPRRFRWRSSRISVMPRLRDTWPQATASGSYFGTG